MKKVLFTSSSKGLLSRNASLLADKGFKLFTASNGNEAVRLHAEYGFDLILSELHLDDMDGCRLCTELHGPGTVDPVPVIIICHDTEEQLQKVKQSSASAIILRPINPTHLLITIGSFIDMQLARSTRVAFKSVVLLAARGAEFLCDSQDISATGIRVETDLALEVGARVTCQFTLPEISQIRTESEIVRWHKPSFGQKYYGIKFINLPWPDKKAIERYVAAHGHLGIRQLPHRPLERSNLPLLHLS